MTPTPRARRGDLRQSPQLDVRLTRNGRAGTWTGEVCRPGASERLCFLTLPSLLAWIAALEPAEQTARSG
jgi:hypothetical protein